MALSDWLQQQTLVPGLISVYKPYGISSTVLTELYKRSTREKVGHGGTLDPLAEGQMLLGIGKGTKLLENYLSATKSYTATILLGATTPSLDLELEFSSIDGASVSENNLLSVINELERPFEQVVPSFSAVKIGGKTSYELARKGQEVSEKRIVTQLIAPQLLSVQQVTSLQFAAYLLSRLQKMNDNLTALKEIAAEISFYTHKSEGLIEKWQGNFRANSESLANSEQTFTLFEITTTVPKGTYIRSLASDIATRLGTIAVLTKLVRNNAGSNGAK